MPGYTITRKEFEGGFKGLSVIYMLGQVYLLLDVLWYMLVGR